MFEELKKYKSQTNDIEVTEIKVNLPNGDFIAGKWWGNRDKKPILCLHGWQDNAGTYDRLIPLLTKDFSYLAIEFFGHGRSSWLPNGVAYNVFDNILPILYLMKEYNWDTIGLIGHSLGAMVAFQFAILFPHKVDVLIKIDSFKTLDRSFEDLLNDTRENVLNFLVVDERIRTKSEPPCYTIQEMIKKVNEGSFMNITTESAPYLLERNIARSLKYPDKFYFSRDPRLRFIHLNAPDHLLESSKRIKGIPFLLFTTKETSPLYARTVLFPELLKILNENPKFRLEVVDSDSHYFHLNNPNMISQPISDFLIKHKKLPHHL